MDNPRKPYGGAITAFNWYPASERSKDAQRLKLWPQERIVRLLKFNIFNLSNSRIIHLAYNAKYIKLHRPNRNTFVNIKESVFNTSFSGPPVAEPKSLFKRIFGNYWYFKIGCVAIQRIVFWV